MYQNGCEISTDYSKEYRNGESRTSVYLPYKIGPTDAYLDGLKVGIYVENDGDELISFDRISMKYAIPYTEGQEPKEPENPLILQNRMGDAFPEEDYMRSNFVTVENQHQQYAIWNFGKHIIVVIEY